MKSQSNIRVLSILRTSVSVASIFTVGVGLLVLIGWIFNITPLKNIIPDAATMKFNTALCFFLAGISLWLLKNEEGGANVKHTGQIFAGLVVFIGMATIGEYLFGWNLGIDQLVIKDLATLPSNFPGRMSGITAVGFALSGIALLLIENNTSQYFSVSMIILSLLAVIGYLFDYQALYQLSGYGTVALHTAITFLILSVAVFFARPYLGLMKIGIGELAGSRAIRLLIPFTVLLTILLGWLVEAGEDIHIFNPGNKVVILVVLLIVIYSPLIYFYASRINRADEQIIRLNRLYATLSQVNQTIVHVKDQQELFENICKVAMEHGKFALAWIGLLDKATGEVRPVTAIGLDINQWSFPIVNIHHGDLKDGLIASAIRTSWVTTSDDVQADKRLTSLYDQFKKSDYQSSAAVPFQLKRKTIGVLSLVSNQMGIFKSKEEVRLLTEMGVDISFALDTIQQEIERRQAEERFQLAIESAPNAIILIDMNGQIILINQRTETYFGYHPDELEGKSVELLVPERLRDNHLADRAGFMAKPQVRPMGKGRDLYGLRKNGSEFPVEIGLAPFKTSNGTLVMATIVDITERKQAEDALRTSEERFRRTLDNMIEGCQIIDFDWRYTYVNDTVASQGHNTREALLGHTMMEMYPGIESTELFKVMRDCMENRVVRHIENEFTYPDGTTGWFELGIQPVPEGIFILSVDVTERKQAEEKIKRSLQHLNGLRRIDQAITSSFDLRTTLEVVLQEVTAQLGVDAAAILLLDAQNQSMEYTASRGFRSTLPNQTQLKLGERLASRALRERQTIYIQDLSAVGGAQIGTQQLTNDGFVEYYGAPLIARDNILGVLEIYHRSHLNADSEWADLLNTLAGQTAIAIDNARLWEQIQLHASELEQRVEKRTLQLNQTNIELEHANRIKDEFLANMSHELRTPLNGIMGMSEMLLEQRRDSLTPHQQSSLEVIESSGQHLLELINDILDLSKIEAGKFDIYQQPIDVDEICRSSLAFVKSLALQKSINLVYEEDKTISKIYVDPRRIKQILVNLLTNAVKFTPDHGQVTLQVRADVDQDLVQFSVIDTGIGITQDDLKRLFRPFTQIDSSLNRQQEGTGLGLALIQKLTDLHGGSVQVESQVGVGSNFTINLPWGRHIMEELEGIEASNAALVENRSIKRSGESLERRTVLLAEDNLPNILTIGEYLEDHNYEVLVAHDGQEAIDIAEKDNPDIILMDIQMPVMDGLEAIRRISTNPKFASVPIIALTALAMPGDRELCLEAGANEYMSKPVSLKKLVKTIGELLAQ